MIPDGESLCVLLEVRAQPVGTDEELSAAFGVRGAAELVVVSQAVLCDCDGVVLQTDCAVIVELRNAGGVIEALMVRFFGEEHGVLAQICSDRVRILRGSLGPEGEVALASDEIGAEDASVVAETGQGSLAVSLSILRQDAATASACSGIVRRASLDGRPRAAVPHGQLFQTPEP